MTEPQIARRLAAILAADVAGYSRMVGADEAGTITALRQIWTEVFNPAVAARHGRVVKTMGDGALVEFGSAIDAVECAVALQRAMAERNRATERPFEFRIGINLGDIIIDGDDILGDGVNIAARLEGQAPHGGILASDVVHAQVNGKIGVTFVDAGEVHLKNIDRPLRVWRWDGAGGSPAAPRAAAGTAAALEGLWEKMRPFTAPAVVVAVFAICVVIYYGHTTTGFSERAEKRAIATLRAKMVLTDTILTRRADGTEDLDLIFENVGGSTARDAVLNVAQTLVSTSETRSDLPLESPCEHFGDKSDVAPGVKMRERFQDIRIPWGIDDAALINDEYRIRFGGTLDYVAWTQEDGTQLDDSTPVCRELVYPFHNWVACKTETPNSTRQPRASFNFERLIVVGEPGTVGFAPKAQFRLSGGVAKNVRGSLGMLTVPHGTKPPNPEGFVVFSSKLERVSLKPGDVYLFGYDPGDLQRTDKARLEIVPTAIAAGNDVYVLGIVEYTSSDRTCRRLLCALYKPDEHRFGLAAWYNDQAKCD